MDQADDLEQRVEDDWRFPHDAKVWGDRPWANKEGRLILNDASEQILNKNPDFVDDPTDPKLDEVLQFIQNGYDPEKSGVETLPELLQRGLTPQETIVWYLWEIANWEATDIYYSIFAPVRDDGQRIDTGGHASDRRNAARTLQAVLQTAALKLGEEPPDVDISEDEPADDAEAEPETES